MRSERLAVAVALGLWVLTAQVACSLFSPTQVDQTQTVTIHDPAPSPSPSLAPSPSPSPGGVQGQGPITGVKVTFVDGSPGAGDKTLVVGEKGTITASPLNIQGVDPCKGIPNGACTLYTQADIAWEYGAGVTADCAGVVRASDAGAEAYNLDLEACNAGTFTVTARFRQSITGSLTGTVVKP